MTIQEYWRRAKARQRHFERLVKEEYGVQVGWEALFDHTNAGRHDRRRDPERILGVDGLPIDDE